MAFICLFIKESLMPDPTPLDQLTYEQAFTELEAVVAALESDQRSLDEAMALFERGQALASYCVGLLEQAELKVQQLSGGNLTDFTPPA
jgi:exodeoxyribonuclease VII small subunit